MNLARFDLAVSQRENLEQRDRFLHVLVAVGILNDHFGLTVPGDDRELLPDSER